MKQYAKITAVEMAQKHGLAPDRVAWDEDEAQALREDYAERRQHLGA
jgi:hypothetical protein